jgi:DNA polymerase I-like protein with 3'-5' exonuclease and polymerase domains
LYNAFWNKDDPHSSTAINMNNQHRLSRMGVTPAELKKLAGMDKVIYKYVDNVLDLYEKEPKLVEMIDKYIYKDGDQSSIKSMVKKLDNKQVYKMIARLQKEAKDLRAEGKLLNFAIIYGFGDGALAKALGLATDEQGRRKKNDYFRAYEGVARWVQNVRVKGKRQGYVTTLLGKKRRKPNDTQASNAPIQGSAGDIVKSAQLKLDRHPILRMLGFKQLMQIHDELICEVPEANVERAMYFMQRLMEHPLNEDLIVPLVAEPESGDTWNQCK